MRFLIGRVAPLAAAGALFSSGLSPIQPALNAFGMAANALAGAEVEGVAFEEPSLPTPGGFFGGLFGRRKEASARRQVLDIQERLKARAARTQTSASGKKPASKSKPASGGAAPPARGSAP